MRAGGHCGVVWTLHRDGHTRSAEIREVAAGGLKLRLRHDGTLIVWHLFRDGADLLNAAAIERFELEALGWGENSAPGRTTAKRS